MRSWLILAALAMSCQVAHVANQRPIDTKLFDAVSKGDVAKVKLLLDQGANPNANMANGWRPLLNLSSDGAKNLAIAKLLVAHGAKLNYRQPDQGWSPVSSCLNRSDPGSVVLKYLISKGAPVDIPLSDGTTALMLAVRNGNLDAVQTLLAHGADVDARTAQDPNATHDAETEQAVADSFEPGYRFSGQTVCLQMAGEWNPKIAEALEAAHADFKAADDNGWTGLHYAAKYGSEAAIRGFLGKGLDPNAASKAGYRPLHVALRSGYGMPSLPIVQALIAAGADRSAQTMSAETPGDLLRKDVARNLRKTMATPGELARDTMMTQYLALANKVAQVLDPGSPEIVAPKAPVVDGQTQYPPLNLGFGDSPLLIDRTLKLENGHTVLTLKPEKPLPDHFRIIEIQLNNYDPISPLPVEVDSKAGCSIKFPAEAIESGAAINIKFGEENGGGSTNEGWYPNPGFVTTEVSNGRRVSIECDLRGRPLEVRIDSIKVGSKVFKSDKLYVLTDSKPVAVNLLLPPKGKAIVSYRLRLRPNTRWITQSITLD